MTNPKYTEDEVWDLLSEYLVKKFQADHDTVQRGIYVDLYRDGCFFEVLNNPDNFAYLYCSRNINFNISGNIVFSMHSENNEDFTLESICEYLNKPFPKVTTSIELTDAEYKEKLQNLATIKKISKANHNREKIKSKIRRACISLIHAFEYERASLIKNDINHIEQVISHVGDFNFIQERDILNTQEMLIIDPIAPLLDDILVYFEKNKDLIKDYFKIRYKDIEETLKDSIYPNYEKYFSERVRRFGSLLIPLYNVNQRLVSAINIANISLGAKTNYLILKENFYTKGSFQTNAQEKPLDCIFLTVDIDTADTLSRATKNPIYTSINEENLIEVFDELREKFPDIFIVLVLNNPFSQFLNNGSESEFRKSSLVRLMIEFGKNPRKLIRSGIIIPSLDLLNKSQLSSFSDIYLEFGIDETTYQINHELNVLSDRLEKNTNESEYISALYLSAKNILYGNHHLRLPELATEEELNPKTVIIENTLPDQPIIPTHGENSVLFLEKRKSLSDWLNEPIHPEVEKAEKRMQQQISRFVSAAPIQDNDEFN